jgi:uncharacterized membrane protein
VAFDLYLPALLTAILITILEMTEVVILVIAMGADHPTARPGAAGAVLGTAVVGVIALAAGAAIAAISHTYLLWASAVVLAAFGLFLLRSTWRSYRRARAAGAAAPRHHLLQFAGGFSVGAVETTEVVIVLIALAAAGYAYSALVGALIGGGLLIVLAFPLHERLRRIKVPVLKLVATSVLFAFAVFWTGEALGIHWPGNDLFLIPLALLAGLIVRGALELGLRHDRSTAPG